MRHGFLGDGRPCYEVIVSPSVCPSVCPSVVLKIRRVISCQSSMCAQCVCLTVMCCCCLHGTSRDRQLLFENLLILSIIKFVRIQYLHITVAVLLSNVYVSVCLYIFEKIIGLHSFIRKKSTRPSSVVTLARPSTRSTLKITDRSFRHASPRLWSQLPDSSRGYVE